MKKMFLYTISYFHSTGSGCSQIARNKKINSLKEYNEVRKYIEKKNNLKNVVIINYQLICKLKQSEVEAKLADNKQSEGEWKIAVNPVEAIFICSECGYSYIEADPQAKTVYKYCPNCGAKMKGGEE